MSVQNPFETYGISTKIKQLATTKEELCKVATKGSKDCKFMLNLRDKNRRLLSCANYCMLNCTPEQLLPLFDIPQVVTITGYDNNETKHQVKEVNLVVSIVNMINTKENYRIVMQWNFTNEIWNTKINDKEISFPKEMKDGEGEARMLCEFLKRYPNDSKISFDGTITVFGNRNLYNFYNIAGITFDKPYIRPESQWSHLGLFSYLIHFELRRP